MKASKRAFLGMASAAALAATTFSGMAQAWEPTKPIDFVIMAGAGGGADQIARFIQSVAEKKKLTPRPLIPNNKGGGSGAWGNDPHLDLGPTGSGANKSRF